jgi:hypothetical protein
MAYERIRKMTDAIRRSRAARAESQRLRRTSHKLIEQAERRLYLPANASRRGVVLKPLKQKTAAERRQSNTENDPG